jgi:hypothetical protein
VSLCLRAHRLFLWVVSVYGAVSIWLVKLAAVTGIDKIKPVVMN